MRDDDPLYLGPVLMSAQMLAALSEADLLIAVGTRFQAGVAGRQIDVPLPPIVHIDADPRNINLNYKAAVGLVGDAKLVIASLTQGIDAAGDAQYREKLQTVAEDVKDNNRQRIGPDHCSVLDLSLIHI